MNKQNTLTLVESLLIDYASGSLPLALEVLVESHISINPSTKSPEFSSNLGVFFSSLFGSLFMFGSQCIYFGNLDSPSSKNLAGTEVAFCKPLAFVALAGSVPLSYQICPVLCCILTILPLVGAVVNVIPLALSPPTV